MQLNHIFIFQIEKGKLWNDLDEQMENHGLDSPVYEYAKQKATDTVGELLETRTNIQGYAIAHLQLDKIHI